MNEQVLYFLNKATKEANAAHTKENNISMEVVNAREEHFTC